MLSKVFVYRIKKSDKNDGVTRKLVGTKVRIVGSYETKNGDTFYECKIIMSKARIEKGNVQYRNINCREEELETVPTKSKES